MKYGNKKTTLDGHIFDSKRESQRYAELKLYEKAGMIMPMGSYKKRCSHYRKSGCLLIGGVYE